MLPRRITGLCKIQQKYIGKLVSMAQKSGNSRASIIVNILTKSFLFFALEGLMPNFAPAKSNRDPKRRFGWRKYNKYFDEKTIKYCKRVIE